VLHNFHLNSSIILIASDHRLSMSRSSTTPRVGIIGSGYLHILNKNNHSASPAFVKQFNLNVSLDIPITRYGNKNPHSVELGTSLFNCYSTVTNVPGRSIHIRDVLVISLASFTRLVSILTREAPSSHRRKKSDHTCMRCQINTA
jgi:hypothetical protein